MPTAPMVLPDWSLHNQLHLEMVAFLVDLKIGLPVSITRISSSSAFLPMRPIFEAMITLSVLPRGVTCNGHDHHILVLRERFVQEFLGVNFLAFLRQKQIEQRRIAMAKSYQIESFLVGRHFIFLRIRFRAQIKRSD